jgi:hypothetical protein
MSRARMSGTVFRFVLFFSFFSIRFFRCCCCWSIRTIGGDGLQVSVVV